MSARSDIPCPGSPHPHEPAWRRLAAAVSLVATLLAGCGAPPPPHAAPALRVAHDPIDGRALLEPVAARAVAAGAGPLLVLGADLASEGERVGAFVELAATECMLAFARGSSGLADLDLFSYQDDGEPLVTDESPSAEAAILVCPPHPRRLYIVARVMAGTGLVGVGVQVVPPAKQAAVASALGVRGRGAGQSGRLDAWPGLEARLHEHREALGSRWEDLRRAALPVDPRAATRLSVTVPEGRCLDVLMVPSDEVASVELVAEDLAGRVVARAHEHGRDRSLLLCSAAAVELSLALRPRASQGLVALLVGRSDVGAAAELSGATYVTQPRELAEARAAHASTLRAAGFGPAKGLGAGQARVGERLSLPIELPAGCARIDVIAGSPLVGIGAELWDPAGHWLAGGSGGAVASLFACGPGGAAELDVSALNAPGPFAVELREDPVAPAPLVAHPVAAGRLLQRLSAGGAPPGAREAKDAVVVALDAEHKKTLPLTLPARTCADVTAALDRGGVGLDLRLVGATATDSVSTRARDVAAARLCADRAPVHAKVELRLLTGRAAALVVTRLIATSP
jgi:hypothetical protein